MKKTISLVFLLTALSLYAGNKKPFDYADAMKFKSLQKPAYSLTGAWLAYSAFPDRGDNELIIHKVSSDTSFKIERGFSSKFSNDEKWLCADVRAKSFEIENSETEKDRPKSGMALMNLKNGKVQNFEKIEKFFFSEDSKWLAYKVAGEDNSKAPDAKDTKKGRSKRANGSDLILRHLESGSELSFRDVVDFAFDTNSVYIFYTTADPSGKKNGVFARNLTAPALPEIKIIGEERAYYSNLAWNKSTQVLAFVYHPEDKVGYADRDKSQLFFWSAQENKIDTALNSNTLPMKWFIPAKNELKWTQDFKRLYMGLKPYSEKYDYDKEKVKFNDTTLSNIDTITKKKELIVWHWNDPRIKTNQVDWWNKNKDRNYLAYYDFDKKKIIQIANEGVANSNFVENPNFAIAYDENTYLKDLSYDNGFHDAYIVNLKDGSRKKFASKLESDAFLSPNGFYATFYRDSSWFMYDVRKDSLLNLTKRLKVGFFEDDWDKPSPAEAYGFGGWIEHDVGCLIYDKYDIWEFFTDEGNGYLNISGGDGREKNITYRINNLDPDKKYYKAKDTLFISGFNQIDKTQGLYVCSTTLLGLKKLVAEPNKYFTFRAKPKNATNIFYSRQSFSEFPDIWNGGINFDSVKKITNVNPQMSELEWGSTKLISWKSYNGDSLQGYVMLPANFDSTKKYPTLVYFYERFSDRMNNFVQPALNTRPCFQLYNSSGYVVFVPDITFTIGSPGHSAVQAITSGLRKLAEMGIADTNALGLQGHSWGGYQTGYIITATNMFSAACAGAPVGNMISAYNGIRTESGMVRQMQYEKQQSRIGGTLWDSTDAYLKSSTILRAKNINTPLLIEFGDDDEAVPFSQGVELYMSLRRLNKPCIMLQYKNEPHHLRKYHNKTDYAIKMKEFFDAYMLKKPMPEWLKEGVEYNGN